MRLLDWLVFCAGLVTLALELAAARLLDPWFGNSLIVWANLIGLILLYLAAGSWLGGRLADRAPTVERIYRLAAWAAAAVGLVPVLSQPVLRLAAGGFSTFDLALLLGSLAGVLVLFALPVILLGCVTPYAIRLSLVDVGSGGRVTGRLSALSTLGSILGTFLAVLVLIPNLGTRRTFYVLSLGLLALAAFGLWRARGRLPWRYVLLWILIMALALLPPGAVKPDAGLLYEKESAYNYIQVLQGNGEILLKLNEGEGLHSVYRPGGGLAGGIWDYFLLAPCFTPAQETAPAVRNLAMIGLAAGTIPRLYTEVYGPIPIDGVELDAAVITAGRRYFGMNEANLHTYAEDGRFFLTRNPTRYDVIAIDAYRPPYIPFHLTTVEFFSLVRDHLTPGGVVAVNVARTHADFALVDALSATMQAVFPGVLIVDEPDAGADLGNSLLVAGVQPATLADWQTNLDHLQQPLLSEMARRAQGHARLATRSGRAALTDDRAPVEQIVHAMIVRYLTAGP